VGCRTAWAARMLLAVAAGLAGAIACAQPLLMPLAASAPEPAPPWRLALLPKQKPPATQFSVVMQDGMRALRVAAEASYGNLAHPVTGTAALARTLAWRWRLEQPLARADLKHKDGDDVAAKVCAMFDLPINSVPFVERQLLRLARSRSGEDLPAATLCYAWDPSLPAGAVLPNAYTRRVRYLVVQGQGSALRTWRAEQRDLRADFLRAFGDETSEVPPLSAILVGADADNTGGQSLAFVADLELRP
jgi:hypothetical protein